MEKKKRDNIFTKIRYYINEIVKMYSEEKSFFSKKRVESGIAFFIGQFGMVYFLIENMSKLTATDITMWAALEFAIAGYMISQIQKEKKNNNENVE